MKAELIDGKIIEIETLPEPERFSNIPQDISISSTIDFGVGERFKDVIFDIILVAKKLIRETDIVKGKFFLLRELKVQSAIKHGEEQRISEQLTSVINRYYEQRGDFNERGVIGEIEILKTPYAVIMMSVSRMEDTRQVNIGSYHVYDYGSLDEVGSSWHSPSEYSGFLRGKFEGNVFAFELSFQRKT